MLLATGLFPHQPEIAHCQSFMPFYLFFFVSSNNFRVVELRQRLNRQNRVPGPGANIGMLRCGSFKRWVARFSFCFRILGFDLLSLWDKACLNTYSGVRLKLELSTRLELWTGQRVSKSAGTLLFLMMSGFTGSQYRLYYTAHTKINLTKITCTGRYITVYTYFLFGIMLMIG